MPCFQKWGSTNNASSSAAPSGRLITAAKPTTAPARSATKTQPGKPDRNAFIERFNRSYRTEVLNAHVFDSTTALQALTDT